MFGIVHEIDALTPRMSPYNILVTELQLVNDLMSAARRLVGLATRGTDTGGPEVRPVNCARVVLTRMEAGVAQKCDRSVVRCQWLSKTG